MSETQTFPSPPARRRIPVYVQSLLYLLCGLIIGAGGAVLVIRGAVHRMVAEPELLPARMLQRMESQLDLDETQRAAIEGIVAKRIAAFRAIRDRMRPEIQSEIDGLRNDVSAVLNPDQRETWETRFDAIRARWQPAE
jgi:hypothetical protein